MLSNAADPDNYSGFYTSNNLGFDLRLVNEGFNIFRPYFRGEYALELGPATGYMTEHLVKCFKQLTVVDGSCTLLNQIPDYDNIIKAHSMFENYKPKRSFDTIIINHVLEHLQDPVLVLNSVYNWLSDNGVCIVGVPNAKSFHRLAAVQMGLLSSEYELNQRDKELGHFRVYDLQILREHVRMANFNIVDEGGIFLKFLSNQQIETLLPEIVVNAYFKLANQFYQNSAEIYLVLTK